MTFEVMVKFVKDLGFPIFVAVLLLWVMLFRTPAATAADVVAVGTKIETHIESADDFNDKELRFLYLMCLNTAKTQSARDACESVLK